MRQVKGRQGLTDVGEVVANPGGCLITGQVGDTGRRCRLLLYPTQVLDFSKPLTNVGLLQVVNFSGIEGPFSSFDLPDDLVAQPSVEDVVGMEGSVPLSHEPLYPGCDPGDVGRVYHRSFGGKEVLVRLGGGGSIVLPRTYILHSDDLRPRITYHPLSKCTNSRVGNGPVCAGGGVAGLRGGGCR